MELLNQTGLAAEVFISDIPSADGARRRGGLLCAKATFDVGTDGRLALSIDGAAPILEEEVETELGPLPRDVLPQLSSDGSVEVILLGAAYPSARVQPSSQAHLQIAGYGLSLRVFGDRQWIGEGAGARISDPLPFARMPLTWANAYGGACTAWLDDASPIPIAHRWNRFGKGFDPTTQIRQIGEQWGTASGFPRTDYHRVLPNIESPNALIDKWDDEPLPVCWATMPLDLGLRAKPFLDAVAGLEPNEARDRIAATKAPLRMACPELTLAGDPSGLPVTVSGCLPQGRSWEFRIPTMHIDADYVVGSRNGTQRLSLRRVLLLPEQSQLIMTYAREFRMTIEHARVERSFRLRVQ